MNLPSIRRLNAGEPISAAWLNDLVDWIERVNRLHVTEPLAMSDDDAGPCIHLDGADGFLAQINDGPGGADGLAYGWIEMTLNEDGVAIPLDNPRTGTTTVLPAFEANQSTDVAVGQVVWLEPANQNGQINYVFVEGGSGGSANSKSIFARITTGPGDINGLGYGWVQLTPIDGTQPNPGDPYFEITPNGLSGTQSQDPAFEMNGSDQVEIGQDVILWRGAVAGVSGQQWLFSADMTVKYSDNSFIVTGVTAMAFEPQDFQLFSFSNVPGKAAVRIQTKGATGSMLVCLTDKVTQVTCVVRRGLIVSGPQ